MRTSCKNVYKPSGYVQPEHEQDNYLLVTMKDEISENNRKFESDREKMSRDFNVRFVSLSYQAHHNLIWAIGQNERRSLNEQRENALKSLQSYQSLHNISKEDKESLQREQAIAQKEIDSFRQQLSSLETQYDALETRLRKEQKAAQGELKSADTRIGILEEDKTRADTERDDFKDQLTALTSAHSVLTERKAELENELSSLRLTAEAHKRSSYISEESVQQQVYTLPGQ